MVNKNIFKIFIFILYFAVNCFHSSIFNAFFTPEIFLIYFYFAIFGNGKVPWSFSPYSYLDVSVTWWIVFRSCNPKYSLRVFAFDNHTQFCWWFLFRNFSFFITLNMLWDMDTDLLLWSIIISINVLFFIPDTVKTDFKSNK